MFRMFAKKKRVDTHGFMKENKWDDFKNKISIVHVSEDGSVKDVVTALKNDYGMTNDIINAYYLRKNSDPVRYYKHYLDDPYTYTIRSLIRKEIISNQTKKNARKKKKSMYNEIRNLDEQYRYGFMNELQGYVLNAYKNSLRDAAVKGLDKREIAAFKKKFMNRLKITFGSDKRQLNQFSGVNSMKKKLNEEKHQRKRPFNGYINGYRNYNNMTSNEITNWIHQNGISANEINSRIRFKDAQKKLKQEMLNEGVYL